MGSGSSCADSCSAMPWLLLAAAVWPVAAPGPAGWPGPAAGVWPSWSPCLGGGGSDDPACQSTTTLRVGAVQLTDFADGVNRTAAQETAARTAKAVTLLAQAAHLGVELAVFPEMGLVQYNGPALLEGQQSDMVKAEDAIAAACRERASTLGGLITKGGGAGIWGCPLAEQS